MAIHPHGSKPGRKGTLFVYMALLFSFEPRAPARVRVRMYVCVPRGYFRENQAGARGCCAAPILLSGPLFSRLACALIHAVWDRLARLFGTEPLYVLRGDFEGGRRDH